LPTRATAISQNDRRLSDADIATLVNWVDAGAPEGDPKSKPAPLAWTEGWSIKPDVVFEMPKPYTVPKDGTIEYTYFVVPSGFTKDTWVTDAEIRPGNRKVVHHVSVYVRPPGSAWMKDAKPARRTFRPSADQAAYRCPRRGRRKAASTPMNGSSATSRVSHPSVTSRLK
jgi:hypothetical protein